MLGLALSDLTPRPNPDFSIFASGFMVGASRA